MNAPHAVGDFPPLQRSPVLLAASRLYTGPQFRWRPLAFTVVIRLVGGLPPLQWSPVLLVASAFTYMLANVVEWLAQIMANVSTDTRVGGGLPPLLWFPALLAASRLYIDAPPLLWSAALLVAMSAVCYYFAY